MTTDLESRVWTTPRRNTRIVERHGRETYSDTGRPVDERLGSHIVMWIVDDADAWARAIEADGDAELTRWPSNDRDLAEHRRAERYESAAQIRAKGARCDWYADVDSLARAEAMVAALRRSHPNPGVRYEVAPITAAAACGSCHQPVVQADGVWRHHAGRYPVECHTGPCDCGEVVDGPVPAQAAR